MEFPDLGTHCSLPQCNQLDFLPFKCEACGKIFCKEHYSYAKHNCPNVKDRTIPTCPVCDKPVPMMNRDEEVDVVVNRHIENDCALGRRNTKTKCEVKGCREREFVKVECDQCHRNFCLRHRHPPDHQCQQFLNSPHYISKPGAAALERASGFFRTTANFFSNNKTTTTPQQRQQHTASHAHATTATTQQQPQRVTATHVHSLQQPGLSEEEALTRALEESIQQQPQQQQQTTTENDEHIARALQEREYLERSPQASSGHSKQSCSLS